jgi:hypothetical protein
MGKKSKKRKAEGLEKHKQIKRAKKVEKKRRSDILQNTEEKAKDS